MSTGSVIGALKVVLGGDNSGLDKSLRESQGALAAFSSKAALGLAAVAAAAAGAAVALGVKIKSSIDAADKLNKLSQSSGMSTEEFSKLAYAGELADVPVDALGKSVGKLSKALVSAATDAAGPAAQAFGAMGVAVKNQDGTLRSSSDVLKDLAEKFSGYRDGAEKTSLAIQLFGKAGAAMIPLLNGGRDGLEEAGAEAQKFGLVLDKKTTMAAEAFNDNLKRMDSIKQGLVMTLTARMLPSFERLSEVMLEGSKNTALLNSISDALAGVLKSVVTVGITLITTWQQVFATISGVREAFSQLTGGNFQAAFDKMASTVAGTGAAFSGLKQTVSTLWSDMPVFSWESEALGIKQLTREVGEYAKAWTLTAAPIVNGTEVSRNALQKFLDTQAKSTAAQNAQADSIGKTIGMQAQLKVAYEADAIAKTNNIVITEAMRAKIAEVGDAAALAAMKVAGANATVAAQNPAQQFQAQMDQLRQLYDAGVISLETYGARQQQIAEQAGATWEIAGASIAGSFAAISSAFGKESSAMATAAKVFGIIQGTISMFTGAAKALELPFPANLAAMAAVLAKGASLVASIKSTAVPSAGLAMGGAFRVPGGVGGGDKVPFSAMLEPGELVEVSSNRPGGYQSGGGDRGGRAQSGGTTLVYLDAALQPLAAALFPHFNEAMRNGHELKLAKI